MEGGFAQGEELVAQPAAVIGTQPLIRRKSGELLEGGMDARHGPLDQGDEKGLVAILKMSD